MLERQLGDHRVGAVALGGASWSLTRPLDAVAARRVIDAAIANGITLTVELELSADELRTLSAEAH
jgi:aryl-alcohol dehydrogenase-like predicted oxidoreductase